VTTTRELESTPSLLRLYAQAAVNSARGGGGDDLPDTELVLRDVEVDLDHLAEYARVCGYRYGDVLPPTYPHISAFPLAAQIMAQPEFPFALPGLVHIGNRITQHRPIRTAEALTFRVRTENLRDHAKGRQFDIVADASVDGETVWEEVGTILRKGGGGDPEESHEPLSPPEVEHPTGVWSLGADVGRRYAAVSGDRNPIHLYPLTAKALGFPRQIAHGMWSKARCLAALEGRIPPSYEVAVEFRKPVILPTKVAFAAQPDGEGGWRFGLTDARKDRQHLVGHLVERG
jgi:acyl dehydratase